LTWILAAGKVKNAFFDKTGAFTEAEEGLRFVSAQRSDGLVEMSRTWDVAPEPLLQLGISCCQTPTLNAGGDLVRTTVGRPSALHLVLIFCQVIPSLRV
jgi:hypothetical protein